METAGSAAGLPARDSRINHGLDIGAGASWRSRHLLPHLYNRNRIPVLCGRHEDRKRLYESSMWHIGCAQYLSI